MNILTHKQLSSAIGIETKKLSVYRSREKLIAVEKSNPNDRKEEFRYDINHPINKLFIEDRAASGYNFDMNRIFQKPVNVPRNASVSDSESVVKSEPSSPSGQKKELTLAEKKVIAETKLKDKQYEKAQIEVDKLQGKLVPVDETKHVFLWAANQHNSTFKSFIENELRLLCKQVGASVDETNDLIKNSMQMMENSLKEYQENLMSGIEGIVSEYKEVRGRGEKR
jgi:hypothetical protein